MPLQTFDTTDPLTGLIRFQTSPVYEMIISLRALLQPGRQTAWATRARAILPAGFLDELSAVYSPYGDGIMFFELAVDYPSHDDVPGFIEYVRSLDTVTFMFYLVGRVAPVSTLDATGLVEDRLIKVLREAEYECAWLRDDISLAGVLADVPAFQHRLADLWAWYWEAFFSGEVARCQPAWMGALSDKEAALGRDGGAALIESVTGHGRLPSPLPADHPIREVVFIPIQLLPSRTFMFFGYGNVTVLFDAAHTQERIRQIEQGRGDLLAVLKALSDGTRLDVLRVIASADGKMHGKKIAERLNLSASAVSRHVAQLRDAGLIIDHTHSDRTITYRLQQDVITKLPDRMLEYLFH